MSMELQTALIAAGVALVTALIPAFISWQQVQRERMHWLYDIKTTLSVELHRKRMEEYAQLSKILLGLSTTSQKQLTITRAHQIAAEINEWMYGAGGLVASAKTRTAGWALRDRLLRWKAGHQPKDIMEVRTLLLWSMRNDLDIPSGRTLDTEEDSLLMQLKDEMTRVDGQ